jgi:hypothetical protein
MRVSDLVSPEQKDLARKTGRDLARMYHQGGFKVPNFRDFVVRGPVMELQSPAEINVLHNRLNDMFKDLGLNVAFTNHFIERLLGREQKVQVKEILSSFGKLKTKYRTKLEQAKESGEFEGIIKDFGRELNIVFAIDDPNLEAITVMRKDPRDFHVNNAGGVEFKV